MRLKNERKIVTKGKKKKKKRNSNFFQVFKNFSHQKVLFFGDNWNCYGTQHLKECKNIEPPIYILQFWYIFKLVDFINTTEKYASVTA